ncbi:unannotated protein [freshwater metagenome]|uniref:Unannotated protein n=1 Tax=freshwater metagenome TaxID=449393 RepID=A0A6J7CUP4_9ZZZZ|nr:hypothetical protein [Actinomycetota bacterium]
MTWELASFVVLGLALILGFTWYERSHADSRTLALVATLAALAAIGRIAFAPIPNVKPTTDIVLIAGLALGGAPGFVVGAVAALASNLVFGQGPWTPWQMVAWGLCGLLGALLGRLAGRDIGRVPLAVACGAAGLAFGAVMDLSVFSTYAGSHTFGQYLAISLTSLPFNLAHAVGNVAFALAFGPMLVRALLRFRSRLAVHWEDLAPKPPAAGAAPLVTLLVACVLVAGWGLGGAAQPAAAMSVTRAGSAATWLASVQNTDGGWGTAKGASSNAVQTSWTVIGIAALGRDPLAVRRRGRSAESLLRRYAGRSRTTADLERTALALAAAGISAQTGGLLTRLRAAQDSDGSFDGLVNLTSYGILALRASGLGSRSTVVRRAASWLAARAGKDGGFSYSGRGVSSSDDTAAAVQALVAARYPRAAARGASWLLGHENMDGGWALQPPGASNAQSTALAIQALIAIGMRATRRLPGMTRSPIEYLRSLQMDNGRIRYSRTSTQTPVWVTAQALAALAGRPMPFRLRRP